MRKTHIFVKTLISSALLIGAGEASASAFQLVEISTVGLGRAYAGDAAVGENASVVATNPALMSLFTRPEISLGGIYIDPKVDIKGKIGPYDASHSNIAPNAIAPNFYAVYPINDKFVLGTGINVNYGLATEFSKDYNAGFFGGKTDLKTINFNVSGSYRLLDNLTFGIGLNAVYADAEIERHNGLVHLAYYKKAQEINHAANNMPNGPQKTKMLQKAAQIEAAGNALKNLPKSTVYRRLEGDKWGLGWNAGLVYEFNKNNRLGLAYHSQVNINFNGKYSDQLPNGLSQINQAGSLKLPLPAYLEFSGYHKMTEKLAVHYSIKETFWSKFKELKAIGSAGNELFQKTEGFKDSLRVALGATYDVNDVLTLRAGIAYDESAANDHNTISIPDTARTWYSVGATYKVTPNLDVDLGYSYLIGKKLSFKEEGIPFSSTAKVNIYGLNVNYRF